MKRTDKGTAYRVAVVPVVLSGGDYRTAHEACHISALLWNHGIAELNKFWLANEKDPTTKEMRHLVAAADESLLALHAHTKQAIVDDLFDAVSTARKNRSEGARTRMPWRAKNYRPLIFTAGYGWRVSGDKISMSLGRGRPGISVPLPAFSRDNGPVDASRWGEIKLCWDMDARRFSLHIAYRCAPVKTLNPDNRIAIDEGIINPMTLAIETAEAFEVTVINGRSARAVKHRRNTAVADLRSKMSRCTRGSRQWRKYNSALKKVNSKAKSSLRNHDHQVSRKAANMAIEHDAGTVVVGDVRGIEQTTRKRDKRRFGRHQRRRLSQWSRGRQERYLSEKTGVELTHQNEAYSSQTCPACLTRNRPSGRNYQCQACGFATHRDAVGAINILMRSTHGAYTRIDPNTPVRVTYLRATPLSVARSKANELGPRQAQKPAGVAELEPALSGVAADKTSLARRSEPCSPPISAGDTQKPRP